jgi:uncharacterized protein YbbC (DUF1343 family)
MRWPQTERAWVATSPNIPDFDAALVYPGIGMVGETDVNEGRGTPTPFPQCSGTLARWGPDGGAASMRSTFPA